METVSIWKNVRLGFLCGSRGLLVRRCLPVQEHGEEPAHSGADTSRSQATPLNTVKDVRFLLGRTRGRKPRPGCCMVVEPVIRQWGQRRPRRGGEGADGLGDSWRSPSLKPVSQRFQTRPKSALNQRSEPNRFVARKRTSVRMCLANQVIL